MKGCECIVLCVVGKLCFHNLFIFCPTVFTNFAISHLFCVFICCCSGCVSHEDCLANSGKTNDASLTSVLFSFAVRFLSHRLSTAFEHVYKRRFQQCVYGFVCFVAFKYLTKTVLWSASLMWSFVMNLGISNEILFFVFFAQVLAFHLIGIYELHTRDRRVMGGKYAYLRMT